MFDSHRVVCNPSGRFVCREKMVAEDKILRKMLFFDLQEEICHTISLVGVRGHCIEKLYWLDETHLVAVFRKVDPRIKKKTKRLETEEVVRLQKALYEVDFTKKILRPKKAVCWRDNEMDLPLNPYIAHDFLTLNNKENMVFTRYWADYIEAEEKKHFDDLENFEWFNGNKEDYTWFRFIPKEFDNEVEIGKVWINHVEVLEDCGIPSRYVSFREIHAHQGKLYCPLTDGLLIIDMDEYLNDANKKYDSLISSEHCSILIEKRPQRPATDNSSCLLGELGKDWKIYERIWDIDENRGITQFMIEKANDDSKDVCNSLNRILHPSGHFLGVESHSDNFKYVISKTRGSEFPYWPKKYFTFHLVTLEAITADIPGLLEDNQVIFSKSQYPDKCPPFIKDGRNRLTIPVQRRSKTAISSRCVGVRRLGYKFGRRLTDFLSTYQITRHIR